VTAGERFDDMPRLEVGDQWRPGATEPTRVHVVDVGHLTRFVRWLDRRYAPLPTVVSPGPEASAGAHPFEPNHLRPELCGYETGGGFICGRVEKHSFHVALPEPEPGEAAPPVVSISLEAAELAHHALWVRLRSFDENNHHRPRFLAALAEISRGMRAAMADEPGPEFRAAVDEFTEENDETLQRLDDARASSMRAHVFEAHDQVPEACGFEADGEGICGRIEGDPRHVTLRMGPPRPEPVRTPLPVQDDSPEALRAAVVSLRRDLEQARAARDKAVTLGAAETREADRLRGKVKKLRKQRDQARTRLAEATSQRRSALALLADARKQRAAALDSVRRLEIQVDDLNAAENDDTLWSKSRKEYAVERAGLTLPAKSRDVAYAHAAKHPGARVVSHRVRVTDWEPDPADSPASPPSAPQDVQEPAAGDVGTPDAPGRAQAVLRIVEAARAWRGTVACDVRGGPGVSDSMADLIDALDALGDYATLSPDILRESYLIGWARGVRWAADEADAQSQASWERFHDNADMRDVTDHLRVCADDPKRDTLVPRTDTERF
jgi:hypothetical protein